jgi:hypothetical protein
MSKMTHDVLKYFLTNMKLIYEHGFSHSRHKSKLHRLLAIHNCHYVVEQIIRDQAKDMTFKDALHKIGFEEIIKKVHEKQNIQDYNRLLKLNKIRNEAEHSNIFPDVDTVRHYVRIVGDFLKWSYENYYEVDYESLALEDMILDAPIRRVMLEAKALIEKNDLQKASAKMYEGLAAFKFMSFGFLSDPRVSGIAFGGRKLSNLLADLAFKIILADDEVALKKIMNIKTEFAWVKNGKFGVQSIWEGAPFKNKEEANQHYEIILNIILTYQDRMPASIWRVKNESPSPKSKA